MQDQLKEFVRKQIDKYFFISPSILALTAYHTEEYVQDIRFDKLRSMCEEELKRYKEELSRK